MDNLIQNKRKSVGVLGFLLVIIPFATLGFMSGADGKATFSFVSIIFPENPFEEAFYMLSYVLYPVLILTIISLLLNLLSEGRLVISTLVSVIAFLLHILLYFWVGGAFEAATLGISWYVMGLGFLLLIAAPYLKSRGAGTSDQTS